MKNTYLFHNKGKTALPHSIFLRFPNDERNRSIGLPAYIGGDYNIAGMKWIEDLFTKAKLISFTTTAGVPFIDEIKALTNEHTVLGISLRDFAPSIIEKVHNIVDDYDHVCRERTSIHLTDQKLNTSDFVAGNIAEVVSNTVPAREPNKAVIYSPFGLGVLDLALSNYIYQAAIKNNIGTVVENFLP